MSEMVVKALEDQLTCYRRLAKLAEVQHLHVQQNQTESLMDVLKSRQSVLDEITTLERTLAPAKQNWIQFVASIDTTLRQKAEALLVETRRLLEQITTSDRDDAMVLQQRKLNLGKQITKTSAAGKVNRTYAAAAYGTRESKVNVTQ